MDWEYAFWYNRWNYNPSRWSLKMWCGPRKVLENDCNFLYEPWQRTFHCFHKIEEQILECLAWSHDSPIWASIQQAGSVPSCEDVSIPNQLETGHSTQNLLASPIIHPRVQRICGEEGAARRGEKRALFSIFHSKFNDSKKPCVYQEKRKANI